MREERDSEQVSGERKESSGWVGEREGRKREEMFEREREREREREKGKRGKFERKMANRVNDV